MTTFSVYSKDGCPWCVKAIELLEKHGLKYVKYDLTDDTLRQKFYEDSDTSSVPQIYRDEDRNYGEHIGGYNELSKRIDEFLPPKIMREQKAYITEYPEAIKFAESQNEVFWLDSEIDVSKDVQDIMVNFTEAERHGVVTVLKLFTLYELFAGDEYWGKRVVEMFPRPDITRMANCFSFFELNVHAPFYNKLNEALSLNNEEFYTDYVNDETLSARMKFIDESVNHEDDLVSLAVFSMVEGAILYSSFAFLKHFQAKGKNKLVNVVRGINFSVRDENLHSEGGSWLYRTTKKEMALSNQLEKNMTQEAREKIIVDSAMKLYEHECRIIDMIFNGNKIEGITDLQMKRFVESRINECLSRLEIDPIFEVKHNPISEWFYDGINGYQFHDFFTGVGNAYSRKWDEDKFAW